MDPRQTQQPVNRNPRAMQDIKQVLNPTAAPVNPFTGQLHSSATVNQPVAPPSAASEFAPKPVAPALPPKPVVQSNPPTQPAAMPTTDFKPQVVASIPVAQPGKVASPPPAAPASPSGESADDLDRILEAVNNRVKAAPAAATTPKGKPVAAIAKKVKAGSGKVKAKVGSSKPIGAIVASVSVALVLAATAIFAYRQGASSHVGASSAKVGTTSQASSSIQEAGNLLVKPSDLDDFSQSLDKINNLNDSQDFAGQPLSDQMLGL